MVNTKKIGLTPSSIKEVSSAIATSWNASFVFFSLLLTCNTLSHIRWVCPLNVITNIYIFSWCLQQLYHQCNSLKKNSWQFIEIFATFYWFTCWRYFHGHVDLGRGFRVQSSQNTGIAWMGGSHSCLDFFEGFVHMHWVPSKVIIYHQKVIFPHKSVPYSPEHII